MTLFNLLTAFICRGEMQGMKESSAYLLEDSEHLFVLCPISQAVWWPVGVARPALTSLEDFWRSIGDGPYRRVAEWQLIFATLWSIWINQNDVIFRGRTLAVDAILHDARGLAISWNQGGVDPLTFVPF